MKARSVANRSLARIPFAAALLALIVFALAANAASAAPADFTWSSSTSTTQAAARTSLTLGYSSSSAQTLSRLDVDLPAGMMNNPTSATACPNATFLADKCVAASTVGSVTSQVVVAGRTTLSVPGTIYRVTDSPADVAATYGIVLRPPLSSLGITGKIFLSDSIRIQPTGALRHSIGGFSSIPVGGTTLAARMAQMNMQFLATQPTSGGALLTNPTTCATRQFTATGTFSDQSTKSKTSALTTTGCAAVPFAASFGVSLAKSEPNLRTSFAILLGQSPVAGSQLHTAHINAASIDLSQIGALDLAAFDALPGCTDAQAASTAGCPASSKIGEIKADVEGFGIVSGGNLYRSYAAGHFALGERVGFKASHVSFGGGTVAVTGLPELPYNSLQLAITKDLLMHNGACGTPSASATISPVAPTGTHHDVTRSFQLPPTDCSPTLQTVDAADADLDNDGYADQPFRTPDFVVRFKVADESPIDPAKLACTLTDPKNPSASKVSKGTIKVIKDTETGIFDCQVTGADGGNALMTIQATDSTGHTTALKRTWTVDASPPTIAIDEQGVHYSPSPDVAIPITVSDDSLFNPKGVVDVSCTLSSPSGALTGSAKIITDRDSGRSKGFCTYSGVPEGRYDNIVKARNYVGTVTIVKSVVVVDTTPPQIAIDEQGVHFTASPAFDVFTMFHVIEANPATSECSIGDLDGDGVADFSPCGPGQPVALKKGINAVNVKLADRAGNTSSAVVQVFYDSEPGVLELTDPADADSNGDGIADQPFRPSVFDIPYTFSKYGSTVFESKAECSFTDSAGQTRAKGIIRNIGSTGTPVQHACEISDAVEGDGVMTLSATDSTGHVTVLKRTFTVDTTGPIIDLTNAGDADADGDGRADQPYRGTVFDVPVLITDALSGVDPTKSSCTLTDPQAPAQKKGTVKFFNDAKGFGRCAVSDAQPGEALLTITAVDYVGTVTIVKRTLVIDNTNPLGGFDKKEGTNPLYERNDRFALQWSFDTDSPTTYECTMRGKSGAVRFPHLVLKRSPGHDDGECDFTNIPDGQYVFEVTATDAAGNTGSDSIAVVVDTTNPLAEFDAVNANPLFEGSSDFSIPWTTTTDSPTTYECSLRKRPGRTKYSNIVLTRAATYDNGECVFEGVPEGADVAVLTATDAAGNTGTAEVPVFVDATAPTIAIDEPGAHFTSSPDFDVLFSADDASLDGGGTLTAKCKVRGWNPETKEAKLTKADAGRALDGACSSTGVADGSYEVEITVTDAAGNVATATSRWVVDTTPPVVTFRSQIDLFHAWPSLQFDVNDANPGHTVCKLIDDSNGNQYYVDEDCDDFADSAGNTCDPAAQSTDCARQFVAPHILEKSGRFHLEITHTDLAGNVATASFGFVVDTMPPTISQLSAHAGPSDQCRWSPTGPRQALIRVGFSIDDSSTGSGVVAAQVSFNRGPRQTVSLDGSRSAQYVDIAIDCREMTTGLDVEYRVFAQDAAGNESEAADTLTMDLSPPEITLPNYLDGDDDGDGVANDPLRAENFSVDFDASDVGSGIDPNSAECTVTPRKGGVIKGNITISNGGFRCSFSGVPAGDATFEIQIADKFGSVGGVHRDESIDATPPSYAIKEQGVRFVSSPQIDVFGNIVVIEDNPAPSECSTGDLDGDGTPDYAPCGPGVPVALHKKGLNAVNVKLADRVGHTATVLQNVYWDDAPPTLTLSDPRDDDADGDGVADQPHRDSSFSVDFAAADDGSGVDTSSATCDAKVKNGGKITGAINVNNGNLRCSLSGVPAGDAIVEISVADNVGLVTTVSRGFIVDAAPPVVTIATPQPGQFVSGASPLNVAFSVAGSGPFTTTCSIDGKVALSPCASGSGLNLAGYGVGPHTLVVNALDPQGGSGSRSVSFVIAQPGSPPVCIAIYPPPPGCSGPPGTTLPPGSGGGGVITVP